MDMHVELKRLGFCLLLVGLAMSVRGSTPAAGQATRAQAPGPSCVDVRAEASFASAGYDHLVHLTNGCKQRMSCSVKTDVNPDAAMVSLAPGERQTVVTWRGSPARVFKPDVSCQSDG
jgi:hypothetical protein